MKVIASFLCLLALDYTCCASNQTNVNCTTAKIDIFFILDSSPDVGYYNYQKEKSFIKMIAREFNISRDGTHAGVMTFSTTEEIIIYLNDHFNINDFEQAVDQIRFRGMFTRMDMALHFGQTMFSSRERQRSEKLMVLLTETLNYDELPGPIGTQIRQQGINIIVIGIGNNLQLDQLNDIAGEENVVIASSFDALTTPTFVKKMTKMICKTVYIVGPGEKKYKFYNERKAFDQASQLCAAEEAQLVIGDDAATSDFLTNAYGNLQMWIGAKYNVTLGKWFWIDGQQIDDSYWQGNLVPRGNNLCLTSYSHIASVVTTCDQTIPFLCQKGISIPSPPPVLTYSVVNNKLQFTCRIFRKSFSTPVTYEVTWLQSQADGSLAPVHTELSQGDISFLRGNQTLNLLSKKIQCQVRAWYMNNPGEKSEYSKSVAYFAGIEVYPPVSSIQEGGKPIQLMVSLTVPIICGSNIQNCNVHIEFISKEKLSFSPCSFVLSGNKVTQNVTVNTTTDFVDDGEKTIKVQPRVTSNRTNEDWNKQTNPVVMVKRVSVAGGRCTSTRGPHIRTFDGTYFHHYRVGYYTLVESTSRVFQVQVGTHKCGSVSCNCGVAVREGENILVVDVCRNEFSPQAYYLSNNELDEGTFIERSSNGKNFKLKFSSGAFVTFQNRRWRSSSYANIAVQLPSEDFNNTKGLCGLMDKNKANDMSDVDGVKHNHCGGRVACASFTESWKLTPAKSLFYYKSIPGSGFCLPKSRPITTQSQSSCAAAQSPKAAISKGYTKMLSSAHLGCQNITISVDEILTEDPDITGTDKTMNPHQNHTTPQFPTPTGVTETAKNFCKNRIEKSTLYKVCKNSTVDGILDIDGFIEQCVSDIQILDDKKEAFESAMDGVKEFCEEILLRVPGSKPENLKEVCPNDCSSNGVCNQGTCTCNNGFTSDDCSVNINQIPTLQQKQVRYCDIRSRNCDRVRVSSLDLIQGNITCRTKAMNGGGNLKKYPISTFVSFSEVFCGLPIEHRVTLGNYSSKKPGISSQHYNIALSNDGTRFSNSSMSYVVYDSKCMTCGDLNCTLKKDTCLVNGYCFTKSEADPGESCKICDPGRSNSTFVYNQADVNKCKERYVLDCHELRVTGFWEKDMFGGEITGIHLNDQSCKKFDSNSTHVWITALFKNCNSKHQTHDQIISQENTANITVRHRVKSLVERYVRYQYRMQCDFNRALNVSNANYESSQNLPHEGGDFQKKGTNNFNLSMDLYSSDSFLLFKEKPLVVTSFQPLYVGIKNTNQNYTFVVNRCFATPTANINDVPYMFFDMKCPIDRSFKVKSQITNTFNFTIDAFIFIQMRKSIYLSCELFMCPVGATSEACTQRCNVNRKRRSVIDGSPLEKVKISSDAISFKVITTCKEKICPENSKCLDLYPAECRCNEGFVYDIKKKSCSQRKEVLYVRNLHLDETFISTYSDTTSVDFLMLATKVENELLERFEKDGGKVIGVKVISASPGSIVLDLLLIKAENVTSHEAAESFKSSINQTLFSPNSLTNKIKKDITPSISTEDFKTKVIVVENSFTGPLVGNIVGIIISITFFVMMLILRFIWRRKVSKNHVVKGVDNVNNVIKNLKPFYADFFQLD